MIFSSNLANFSETASFFQSWLTMWIKFKTTVKHVKSRLVCYYDIDSEALIIKVRFDSMGMMIYRVMNIHKDLIKIKLYLPSLWSTSVTSRYEQLQKTSFSPCYWDDNFLGRLLGYVRCISNVGPKITLWNWPKRSFNKN